VKKKTLAWQLGQARLAIQSIQDRTAREQAERQQRFEEALDELKWPADVVRLITPSGRIVVAKVLAIERDQDQTEVPSREGWREFLPGLTTVEIRLAPYPG
jgi:tryptophan 2,3-dioxygenase